MTNSQYRFKGSTEFPSVALCNTLDDRPGIRKGDLTPNGDHLVTPRDVLEWVEHCRLLDRAPLRSRVAAPSARELHALFTDVVELRERFYRIYFAVANGKSPAADDIESFNELRSALPPYLIKSEGRGMSLAVTYPNFASAVIGILVEDATKLLTGEQRERLRLCAAPECGWLFVDVSKNGSRVWCDMGDCGNREKARRFYRTQHKRARAP